jgi:hypothetical protein
MRLFSDRERGDAEPAGYAEPLYMYLDRAGGEYWACLRSLAQAWADDCLIDQAWLGRFQSADDRQHFAAFWELYVATAYRRTGMEVQWLEAHSLGERGRIPDFLISDGDEFIVEVTTATEDSDQIGADRRLQTILDLLNTIDTPNFWLWPRIVETGDGQPSTRKLRQDLEEWAASLDPDRTDTKLSYETEAADRPSYLWKFEGWEIEFAVVPKPSEVRGDPSARPVGLFGPSSARMIEEVTPLRNSLARKSASNYRDVIEDRPYVVAISSHRKWAFESSMDHRVAEALYGREVFHFIRTEEGESIVEPDRKRDGFWLGPSGPEHNDMSAILIVNNLWIGDIAVKTPTLWLNPWAERPLGELRPWRTAVPIDGEVQFHDPPEAMHEVLGLGPDWPGVGTFPDLS